MADIDTVRFLVNDPRLDDDTPVFSEDEITAYLDLEDGNVKRAAAQALDTLADNEALASKAIRTQTGLSIDGPKVADSLRKRAATLRAQADRDEANSDDDAFFDITPTLGPTSGPELATWWP